MSDLCRSCDGVSVIVMAQGDQRRLPQLGYPKQMIELAGETILGRTLRQLRELHVPKTHTVVIGRNADMKTFCTEHEVRCCELEKPGFCVLDGILQTDWDWFTERVIVLLGDVVFSQAAITAIVTDPRPLVFAGTPDVSGSQGEIFGMSFTDHEEMLRLLRTAPCRVQSQVDLRPRKFPRPQGGHLRRLLWWAMLNRGVRATQGLTWEPTLYLPIDDYTDDVDDVYDLRALPELEQAVLSEQFALQAKKG